MYLGTFTRLFTEIFELQKRVQGDGKLRDITWFGQGGREEDDRFDFFILIFLTEAHYRAGSIQDTALADKNPRSSWQDARQSAP